jgi:hypothetical protein
MPGGLLGFLAILVFTVFCIISLIIITNTVISNPLKMIDGHTMKLAQGDVPAENLVSHGLPEIRNVEENLGKLTRAIQEKVDFATSLNEGILDTPFTQAGDNDVLGRQLVRFQQKIRETAEIQAKTDAETMRRRYINEGLANFAAILRTSSDSISQLGDAFIKNLSNT